MPLKNPPKTPPKYKQISDVGTSNPIVFRLCLGLMEIVDQTQLNLSQKDSLKEVCFLSMQSLVKAEKIANQLSERKNDLHKIISTSSSEKERNNVVSSPALDLTASVNEAINHLKEVIEYLFRGLLILYGHQWSNGTYENMVHFFIMNFDKGSNITLKVIEAKSLIRKIYLLFSQTGPERGINNLTYGNLQTSKLLSGSEVGSELLKIIRDLFEYLEEIIAFSLIKFLNPSLSIYKIPKEEWSIDFQYKFRVGLKPGVKVDQLDDSDPVLSKIKKSGIQAYHLREKIRERKFGKVRPIIAANFHGKKAVVVSDSLHLFDKDYKTFTDFLFNYVKICFGKHWWFEQLKKPSKERHPVVQLAFSIHENYDREKKVVGNGLFETKMRADMKSYLTLAYDLYVIKDHSLLQKRVLKRLKNQDQFFGARYELSVIAIFIMAGFEIEFQDERDGSMKHPEFKAKHKETSQKILVEAKRRHRPKIDPAKPGKLGITGLLRKAFSKADGTLPFIVFLDLDLPPLKADPSEEAWFEELKNAPSESGGRNDDGKDVFTLIIFTNFPFSAEKDQSPNYTYIPCISQVASNPFSSPNELNSILDILENYGRVPNFFEE
jgi:hypothetical protein